MNSLFRIATRTLCLGLLAAVSLVFVVTAKGIHPEVLVAFKSWDVQSDLPAEIEPVSPPEPLQFAQVDPVTRLDAPATARTARQPGFQRTTTPRMRTAPPSAAKHDPGSGEDLPQLPPLPTTPRVNGVEIEGDSPDVEVLQPPEEMATKEDFEVASKTPVEPKATPTLVHQKPMAGEPPVGNSRESAAAQGTLNQSGKSDAAALADQVSSLQVQLAKLTAEQEQFRLSQQSQLESSHVLQQQKFQEKLTAIEETLRDLQAKPEPVAKSEPYIQRVNPKEQKPASRADPIVREERPGADGEKRFSIESHRGELRELLDTLTQKANLNLIFTINVEGDVEMSLHNATADEALKAIQNTTGYVVEKAGEKVYVRPGPPMGYQREVFLPPIIKDAKRTPKSH